jgi:hypothetical protein
VPDISDLVSMEAEARMAEEPLDPETEAMFKNPAFEKVFNRLFTLMLEGHTMGFGSVPGQPGAFTVTVTPLRKDRK